MGRQSSLHRNKNKKKAEALGIKDESKIELILPKCKYPISIYTELTKAFANEDYWSFIRKFFYQQPLNGLIQDQEFLQEKIANINLDDPEDITYVQPQLEKVKNGIADYHYYLNFLMIDYQHLYCKQGFSDFAYAGFAKYNDPEKFKVFKASFEENSKIPCAAFEEQKICAALPEEQNTYYLGLSAKFHEGLVEFHHG